MRNLASGNEGGTQAEEFENMVLWIIFGPKSEKVTGEWRRLHNAELDDLYSSSNIRVFN